LLSACGSSTATMSSADVQIALLPGQVDGGRNTLHVELRTAAQVPITDATIALEGNMTHAGMAPVIAAPVHDDDDGAGDGIYVVPFQFSMLGDWIITVAVELADGTRATRNINVTVTEAGIQIHEPANSDSTQAEAAGDNDTAGEIMVQDVMARAAPLAGGNGAIYFTLINGAGQADRLVAVESEVAAAVELHESINENNIMRMEPRPDGFEIPAGGSVALVPGGKHVMLMNLQQPLTEGETITITLRFEQANPMSVTVPIMALGSTMENEHQHNK
jgi:periplasmic copper chaperone A